MNVPIAIKIECARGEILNALESIRRQHDLPPSMLEGVLASVLSEVRGEEKIELINGMNQMLREKDEELKKAKAEAKKVLKAEEGESEQRENLDE